jgi:hypothetical protein
MPTIDVYATARTFADTRQLAAVPSLPLVLEAARLSRCRLTRTKRGGAKAEHPVAGTVNGRRVRGRICARRSSRSS